MRLRGNAAILDVGPELETTRVGSPFKESIINCALTWENERIGSSLPTKMGISGVCVIAKLHWDNFGARM